MENVLYKLHRDHLTVASTVFEGMFASGVPEPGSTMDGTSDSRPIHLPDCKVQDFDHLLSWMYPILFVSLRQFQLFTLTRILLHSRTEGSDKNLDRYISILKLADKFDIAEARSFAKKAIENTHWTANQHAQLISVALKYDMPAWFRESFKTLVRRRVTEFSVRETEAIGLRTMMAIVKTRDAIDHHKRLLAHSPPPIQHTKRCTGLNRNQCATAYEDLWWKHIGKPLLDPTVPIQCWNVPTLMEKITAVGMGDGCLQRTRKWLLNHRVLRADDEVIESAVGRLVTGTVV